MEPLAFHCEQCGKDSTYLMKVERHWYFPNGESEATELIPVVYIFEKCGHSVEQEPIIVYKET